MRVFVATALVLFIVSVDAQAEERGDHRPSEEPTSSTSGNPQNTAPTRQEVLVRGFRETGLSPRALRTLDQAFRANPQMNSREFERVLDEVRDRNGGLLTADQVQDLKRLYDQALAGIEGEPGRELSQAAGKVLKEAESRSETKTAVLDSTKGEKGEAAPQPKGQLSPEAVDGFLKGLNASFGKGVPAQETGAADAGEGLLSERGALAALEKLLGGKDKEKDEASRGGDRDRPTPPGFGKGPGERVRDEDRSKKGDDTHKLLEALKGRDQNRGAAPPPQGGGGGGEKESKSEQKEDKGGGSGDDAPKRKREAEEEPPKKDDKKSDLAKADPSSLLDSLKNSQGSPPPKKSALPPMAPDAAGGLFGGNASASALGGAGAGAGAGLGGMLGGLGGGSFSGGASAFDGDPFSSVGMGGGMGPEGGPGGPGYLIAKEGGYLGGSGGGGSFEDLSAGDFSGGDDDLAPDVAPSRVPTYAEQINMTSNTASDPDSFLLKRYVGYVGRSLCASDDAQKSIGICKGQEAKRQRALWWERMSKTQGETSKR